MSHPPAPSGASPDPAGHPPSPPAGDAPPRAHAGPLGAGPIRDGLIREGTAQGVPPRQIVAPRPAAPTMHPKKVRGGVRLAAKDGAVCRAWSSQRWMRLVEELAPNEAMAEGLRYAQMGQARSLATDHGRITARVQGRLPAAYGVEVRLPVFEFGEWEHALASMAAEARHVAGLLAGDVPAVIEECFAPHGLRLFPSLASDLTVSCTCATANRAVRSALGMAHPEAPQSPWCKHVCCVMALVGDRLGSDPFLIFHLRGLAREDLLERFRQKRAVGGPGSDDAGATGRPVPVYVPRLPGVDDAGATPGLERALGSFWTPGEALEALELPIREPEVSHVLLRRLGASPFEGTRFPLVGLLATCYDLIGRSARAEEAALPPADGHTPATPGDAPAADDAD